MNSSEFWQSIKRIAADGFTKSGLQTLDNYAEQFIGTEFYLNDFHRMNSMAAQREVVHMSLHPFSREQKLQQIRNISAATTSKANANLLRNKLR
jgi:hypothetical protein